MKKRFLSQFFIFQMLQDCSTQILLKERTKLYVHTLALIQQINVERCAKDYLDLFKR